LHPLGDNSPIAGFLKKNASGMSIKDVDSTSPIIQILFPATLHANITMSDLALLKPLSDQSC